MKQLFFYALKQNVLIYFFKKYFHGEKDEKSIRYKYWELFLHLRMNIYLKVH